jgi:hypothetical protein
VRRGLTRGWIALSLVWWISVLCYLALHVFRKPPCYAFDSITLSDKYKGDDLDYAKSLRDRLLKAGTVCGAWTSTDLFTLEGFAKNRAITQVSFAWQEPGGWSTETKAELQVLDGSEITADRIVSDANHFVHTARFYSYVPWLIIMFSMPFAVLGIGAGILWTATGFRTP